ncbi:two component system sensor kinase [Aeromonas diversa]|uniref:two component system sensor kinase n=1 Tax=Aeromonas diversa TaxID=502790 RepID=UPI0039A26F86
MIRLPWRTSLSLRLALTLSGVITLFWLLSTSVALLLDFEQTKGALQRQLISRVEESVYELSVELLDVERDVATLLRSWQGLSDKELRPEHYLAAHYIADGKGVADASPRIQRALAFVEAYGSGGLGDFVDTFVLLDGGVVLSSASGRPTDTPRHLAQLRALRNQVSGGIIWSSPYHSRDGDWHVIAARRDPASGALIGVTVHLPPSFGTEERRADEEIVWLGSQGSPITANTTHHRVSPEGCLGQDGVDREGRFAICREVIPVGWQMQLFTPSSQIREAAFTALHRHLPVALLLLVTLVGLLYLVLQRTLGRRLDGVMRKLTPHVPVALLPALSVEGEDELGRIAQTYNRLLEAVKAQYAVLEARVAERTAELELARRQAEQASANKSEHLNSISHEIRTPLNGIIGALTLLGQGETSGEQRDLLDTGLKCSRHLLEIINNLLDFSRIESGQMVVMAERLDPLPLIDQAMLTVQLPAIEKGLSLHCLLDVSFPRLLNTDGLRLRQILINLLGNAVKFTAGGEVTLRGWSEGERVFVRVTDSGPGIPAARHDDVFTPFHQVDSHKAGSGLGLPIARSLARLLGGDLVLEMVPRGASFRLELPLGEGQVAERVARGDILAPVSLHEQLAAWGYKPELGKNPELEGRELCYLPDRLRRCLEGRPVENLLEEQMPTSPWSLQILLVDDVETNRDIVGRMLRQQGHRVYLAASGADALLLGREHVFDLVLMDMRMPGLSGEETLHLWRDEENGILDPDCPVIALTANAQPGERQRLQRAGFNEYLTKPVTPLVLSQALEFAADLQLERDIELALNQGGAVLGEDPQLRERLAEHLEEYLMQLEEALEKGEEQGVRHLLHTIKGLAGQGGLSLVHEACRHWEECLEEECEMSPLALGDLRRLVRGELGSD